MPESSPETGLFTIGHSTHALDDLLSLLQAHRITAIADVRSSPFSRFNPQFNREPFRTTLVSVGIHYVFLGTELGARRSEFDCYEGNKAKYDLIAKSPLFRSGLERVLRGIGSHRVALLCAEKDPLGCHRSILICRHLRGTAGPIHHIREDGSLEAHTDAETRLLALVGLPERDLFHSRTELIEQAYDIQGDRIAYVASSASEEFPT